MRFYLSICVFFNLLTIVSCKSIEPIVPVSSYLPVPLPPQDLSIVSIPIELDLKPYFEMGEKQVPTKFDGGEHPCDGVAFDYHFIRNPMEWNGFDNKLQINVSGKYWIKMSYCVKCSDLVTEKPICLTPRIPFSCGIDEPMRRMKMQYTTQFKLTENYGLETNTILTELKPLDPCEVTVFSYDATGELLKEVRKSLTIVANELDKDLSKMNFKTEVQSAWNQLNTTFPIEKYGYLHAQPEKIYLTEPKIKNNKLFTTVTISALPVFDNNPKNRTKNPLPPLELIEKPLSDSFSIHLDLNLDYDSLSRTIQQVLGGTELLIKKHKVVLDSIQLAGANAQELLFRIRFSGSKNGVLFIRGVPFFDPATQTIELHQVGFDFETKAVLLKTAKWLFNKRILEEIQIASTQDLKPLLRDAKEELNKSLQYEYEGFKLSGKMNTLEVQELYPTEKNLLIRTRATGKLKLKNN